VLSHRRKRPARLEQRRALGIRAALRDDGLPRGPLDRHRSLRTVIGRGAQPDEHALAEVRLGHARQHPPPLRVPECDGEGPLHRHRFAHAPLAPIERRPSSSRNTAPRLIGPSIAGPASRASIGPCSIANRARAGASHRRCSIAARNRAASNCVRRVSISSISTTVDGPRRAPTASGVTRTPVVPVVPNIVLMSLLLPRRSRAPAAPAAVLTFRPALAGAWWGAP
jgi:hypothetical protein